MIGSLTFTYGDKRFELVEYKSKDKLDKHFRNKLNLNLYLFHNTPEEYVKKVKDSKLLDGFNLKTGAINGTYPAALKIALEHLKKIGIKKLVFLQDDVFSCLDSEEDYTELVEVIKTTTLPYFSIEYNDNTNTIKPLYEGKSFNILDTKSQWFRDKGWWSWDDGAYVGDIDYIMNTIYDDSYFSFPDIWAAEHYLNYKFSQQNASRPICSKGFFRRVNAVGNNNWNRENELKYLNERFV
jgi:hypothetical protein